MTPAEHAATVREKVRDREWGQEAEDALDALQAQAEDYKREFDKVMERALNCIEQRGKSEAERDAAVGRVAELESASQDHFVALEAERDAAVQAAVDYQRQSEEQAEEAIRWRAAAELAHAAMDAVQAVADEQGRAAEHAQQALRDGARHGATESIRAFCSLALGHLARDALAEDST